MNCMYMRIYTHATLYQPTIGNSVSITTYNLHILNWLNKLVIAHLTLCAMDSSFHDPIMFSQHLSSYELYV